jgi:hypothetical protein
VLDNNVLSINWLASLVAPRMAVVGGGSIIVIYSIGGLRGRIEQADSRLTESLAGTP